MRKGVICYETRLVVCSGIVDRNDTYPLGDRLTGLVMVVTSIAFSPCFLMLCFNTDAHQILICWKAANKRMHTKQLVKALDDTRV